MRDGELAPSPVRLIEEVRRRPGLYDQAAHPLDREEKLALWKEVGAALCPRWAALDRAAAYDRVLQLQRKWRSLRDAYNRELRSRRSGVRVHRRVYVYFKKMKFLGGYEGDVSTDSDRSGAGGESRPGAREARSRRRSKARSGKSSPEPAKQEQEQEQEQASPVEGEREGTVADEADGDRLFLLSFLPEMKRFPADIKMWARAQIASVMQEAVTAHMAKAPPTAAADSARLAAAPCRSLRVSPTCIPFKTI